MLLLITAPLYGKIELISLVLGNEIYFFLQVLKIYFLEFNGC